MSYETNFSPVDYLKRRVIFYKKKRGMVRNINKKRGGKFIKKFPQKDINAAIARINIRITEYEEAIFKLSNYEA